MNFNKSFITEEYAKEVKKSLNCKKLFNLIYSISHQLDDNKSKFDKSAIIDLAIQIYSNNRFLYVDEIGRDHKDNDYPNIYFEIKYLKAGFRTQKNELKKSFTVVIKNHRGNSRGKLEKVCDFYLFLTYNEMRIISYENLKNYLRFKDAVIDARIPTDKTLLIKRIEEKELKKQNIDYKASKREMQLKLINSIEE